MRCHRGEGESLLARDTPSPRHLRSRPEPRESVTCAFSTNGWSYLRACKYASKAAAILSQNLTNDSRFARFGTEAGERNQHQKRRHRLPIAVPVKPTSLGRKRNKKLWSFVALLTAGFVHEQEPASPGNTLSAGGWQPALLCVPILSRMRRSAGILETLIGSDCCLESDWQVLSRPRRLGRHASLSEP